MSAGKNAAIKSLAGLLDGQRLQTSVSRWLEAHGKELANVTVERVHARGDDEFVVLADAVTVSGETQELWLELVPDADDRAAVLRTKLGKKRRNFGAGASSVYSSPDSGFLMRPRGLDERLPGISALHNPKTLDKLCEQVLGTSPAAYGAPATFEMLAHRLNKRAVARVHLANGSSFVAKCFAGHSRKPNGIYQQMRTLERQGLPISRPIAYIEEHAILAMQDEAGQLLGDSPARLATPIVRASGRLLARLHATDLHNLRVHQVEDELGPLVQWVDLISALNAGDGAQLRVALNRATEALTRHRRVAAPQLRPCHRDFYDHQVLFDDDSHNPVPARLIDFDTLAWADPALDIGNYLAHLDLARLTETHRSLPASLDDSFVEAYLVETGQDCHGIEAWRNVALLRLACINYFRRSQPTLWLRLLDALDG